VVTEIGFVSLLVAAFGVLGGGLVYLGIRVGRGSASGRAGAGRLFARGQS
jgi:hypothetical protein